MSALYSRFRRPLHNSNHCHSERSVAGMRNLISIRIAGVFRQYPTFYPTFRKPAVKGGVKRESHPAYGGRNEGLRNYLKMASRHWRRNHRSAHASYSNPMYSSTPFCRSVPEQHGTWRAMLESVPQPTGAQDTACAQNRPTSPRRCVGCVADSRVWRRLDDPKDCHTPCPSTGAVGHPR